MKYLFPFSAIYRAAFVFLAAGILPATAAPFTWSGAGADANMFNSTNWSGTAPTPGASNTFLFTGTTNLSPVLKSNSTTFTDYQFTSLTFDSAAGSFSFVGSGASSGRFRFVGTGNTISQNSANNQSLPYLVLNGVNTVQGTGAGTLTIAGVGADVSGTSTLAINRNVILGDFRLATGNSTTLQVYPGVTLTFSKATTLASGTTVDLPNLKINVDASGNGGAAATVQATNASGFSTTAAVQTNDAIFGGAKAMTFSGNFTVLGSGNETLTYNNTGGTLLSGSTIQFGAVNGTGNRTVTLATGASAALTITNGISGSASSGTTGLLVSGSGTVTLNGGNTYNGGTTLSSGTLKLNGANTSVGGTTINGGELQIGNATALGAVTNAALAFGSGSTGTLTLLGTSITLTDLNTNATVGTPVIQNNNVTAATLTLNTANNDVYAGVMQNGAASGALALAKGGVGSLTLSGANTYGGGTTVNAGKLYVNGGVAGTSSGVGSGAVTVNGGTLAGKGNITAGLTSTTGVSIKDGGTLASGDAQSATSGVVDGTHLSINNTLVTVSSSIGTANLTFDLGAGNDAGAAYHTFNNPNTNTTYLSLAGSSSINFAGTTSISLVDLTNLNGTGTGTLALRLGTPYLLINAASGLDTSYLNLVINYGAGGPSLYGLSQDAGTGNGYVVGVFTGGGTFDSANIGTAGYVTPISLLQYGSDGVTPLTAGPNGSYPFLALYLDAGKLEVVPEPGTWALMIGGLVLLIVIQRRKKDLNW